VPKILIVAPSWIGDALLAQPLFARLKKRLPGVVIDALAPGWTAPVLMRMPEIGEVIDAPFGHGELKLLARWRLGRALRGRSYDEAIVLPNTLKSALIPFFAEIPLRVGFVGESRYGLLNLVHKLDEKRMPLMAERYAVWLFGSDKDRGIGEEIVASSEGAAVNLCGRTDLASAIDLLSLAEVVVSNDSGLMHVAAGVGRPVVALYGSSSPEHTPPLARSFRIVRTGIECSPCYARECPLGHFKCMNELAPERVMEEIAAVEAGV
jgi:ADP-heptose:LPS heptosyltransferase